MADVLEDAFAAKHAKRTDRHGLSLRHAVVSLRHAVEHERADSRGLAMHLVRLETLFAHTCELRP
jgi:hypothetical protein